MALAGAWAVALKGVVEPLGGAMSASARVFREPRLGRRLISGEKV